MTMHLYGIRSCDSCRKARQWLDENRVDYRYHDIRDESLDEARLRSWQEQVGWEQLLNRRSLTWRKIPSFDRDNLDADAALLLIQAYPTVMKRPVLELAGDSSPLIGFDEESYAQALTGT